MLETDKRKWGHPWLVLTLGKLSHQWKILSPQHRQHHHLPFCIDTTKCSQTLWKHHPHSGTGSLRVCIHGKLCQCKGPSNNESTALASKSPSKYRFIGLLIKITDSKSDGHPETQVTETAVNRPRNPFTMSLIWFLNLVLHSYPLPFSFPLNFSPHCLYIPTMSQPFLQKFTLLRASLGWRK